METGIKSIIKDFFYWIESLVLILIIRIIKGAA